MALSSSFFSSSSSLARRSMSSWSFLISAACSSSLFFGLGLSGRELVFQLQVLKDEQLEKLAALVVRFLQNVTRARLKKISGTDARVSNNRRDMQVQKETRGLPESPIMTIRINKKKKLEDWGPECFCVVLMFISFRDSSRVAISLQGVSATQPESRRLGDYI